jgi:hypothetical protein
MSNTNTGGPAFPGVEYKQPGGVGVSVMTIVGGMTLRDYFAAKVMHTYLGNPAFSNVPQKEIARMAYMTADLMLEAREA